MRKAIALIIPLILISILSSPLTFAENNETSQELDDADSPFLSANKKESTYSYSLDKLEATKTAAKIKGFASLGLPPVTILPTSPFYPLKLFWEKVVLFFTFSPEKKAEITLKNAEARLAEAYRLIENKEFTKAKETLERYNFLTEQSLTFLPKLKGLNEQELTKLVRKIEANTVKQQSVIAYFDDKTGLASEYYSDLKQMAFTGVEKAIESLVETNMATPSAELKKKIVEILQSNEYSEEVKNSLETKMNERLRREIRKEENHE